MGNQQSGQNDPAARRVITQEQREASARAAEARLNKNKPKKTAQQRQGERYQRYDDIDKNRIDNSAPVKPTLTSSSNNPSNPSNSTSSNTTQNKKANVLGGNVNPFETTQEQTERQYRAELAQARLTKGYLFISDLMKHLFSHQSVIS